MKSRLVTGMTMLVLASVVQQAEAVTFGYQLHNIRSGKIAAEDPDRFLEAIALFDEPFNREHNVLLDASFGESSTVNFANGEDRGRFGGEAPFPWGPNLNDNGDSMLRVLGEVWMPAGDWTFAVHSTGGAALIGSDRVWHDSLLIDDVSLDGGTAIRHMRYNDSGFRTFGLLGLYPSTIEEEIGLEFMAAPGFQPHFNDQFCLVGVEGCLTAIPEPSSFALLATMLAFAGLARRRRA